MKLVLSAVMSLLALDAAQAQTSSFPPSSLFAAMNSGSGGVPSESFGMAINNFGRAVTSTASGTTIWASWGGRIELGSNFSRATAINDAGQVVGVTATPGSSAYQATVATSASDAYRLGTLGGTNSEANAINNLSMVAGESQIRGNTAWHATLWGDALIPGLGRLSGTYPTNSYALGITDLGTLGGTNSFAYGINGSNTVVGQSQTTGDAAYHATLWGYRSGAIDLGTLGGASSGAFAINTLGQVVGYSSTSIGSEHAALWSNGVVTDLGTLEAGARSYANAINDEGQIVGVSANGPHRRAFIATASSGKMTDLNDLLDTYTKDSGWVLEDATGINNRGQVTGNAWNPLIGQRSAFILSIYSVTTVPEPEAFELGLVALAAIGLVAKRKRLVA